MATYELEMAISQEPNLIFLIMKICIRRSFSAKAHLKCLSTQLFLWTFTHSQRGKMLICINPT